MKISVEWGYEEHSITLSPKDWATVMSGKELSILGEGYYYEGQFFWDYWQFTGGLEGDLVVNYGNDGDYFAVGFDGKLRDASITDANGKPVTLPTRHDERSPEERKARCFDNLLRMRFPMAPDSDR